MRPFPYSSIFTDKLKKTSLLRTKCFPIEAVHHHFNISDHIVLAPSRRRLIVQQRLGVRNQRGVISFYTTSIAVIQ